MYNSGHAFSTARQIFKHLRVPVSVCRAQCDIASSSVPGKGLEVVAREPLPAGCQVLLEPAYAFVVRAAYTQSFCEHCLGRNIGTTRHRDSVFYMSLGPLNQAAIFFSSQNTLIYFAQMRNHTVRIASCSFAARQPAPMCAQHCIASSAARCGTRPRLPNRPTWRLT
jgi:hypothetical protein